MQEIDSRQTSPGASVLTRRARSIVRSFGRALLLFVSNVQPTHPLTAITSCVIAVSFVSTALAQSDAPPEPVADVSAPELQNFVEAAYPQAIVSEPPRATVDLRLTVTKEGSVAEVEVVRALLDPPQTSRQFIALFEAAARKAAEGLVFLPARRGDQLVASRILFRYEFSPPISAPPPPAPEIVAPPGTTDDPAAPLSLEVVVHGQSAADRLRNSAEAVKVIETDRAGREAADMAEVLGRTEGVGVRRTGGVGSDTYFSLNGLTGEQVRFFLDGVPLELSGYPFGLGNVPVNLVHRIEIYSGVVPVRFGADALGGAINLVSDRRTHGTHASGSYEVGSFGTHSATLGVTHRFEPSGFFVGVHAFADGALNDYRTEVEATDDLGQLYTAKIKRFHDKYLAGGVNAELGWVERKWAKRLLLRAFASDSFKEYQHDFMMVLPYGGVSYAEQAIGGNLTYTHELGEDVSLDAVLGYSHERGHFLDVDPCLYNWYGRCLFERRTDGETDSVPHDTLSWDHSAFGRFNLEWLAQASHALRLSLAPTVFDRTGEERRLSDPRARDPLSAKRRTYTAIAGVEYQADLFEERLENILFFKQYFQQQASEDPVEHFEAGFGVEQEFKASDRQTLRFGGGNALRYAFSDFLLAKAAYEFATRLPMAKRSLATTRSFYPTWSSCPRRATTSIWAVSSIGRLNGRGRCARWSTCSFETRIS